MSTPALDARTLAAREWDLLVVGGGITGAGILLEAARRGLRALLVEQRDFAWGTSSRSSKLVHGGLRYLAEGQLRLTRESVREREALLREAPGLVEPQGFAFADHGAGWAQRLGFLAVLRVYDRLAGRREPHWESADGFAMLAPNVRREGLLGGVRYTDAKTDDARLVLRVLDEARSHGAAALNYVAVRGLVREGARVMGARLLDERSGQEHAVRARVVVNASGAWAGALAGALTGNGAGPRLRPLRGSHLILPSWRLPLAQAVSLRHPEDRRPVFAFPWEGATLVGTTDVDHGEGLHLEARITRAEFDYLMAALRAAFPQLSLQDEDVIATYAGVRPVIDGGSHRAPSKEKREHVVWSEPGLVSVTGGKLTTFRAIALDTLRHALPQLPGWRPDLAPQPVFAPVPLPVSRLLPAGALRRLAGRYGASAQHLVDAAGEGELDPIPGTCTLWAELRWAARAEQVRTLGDLLLRRTRLGILLPEGGAAHLERVRAICQPELGWSDDEWLAEQAAYVASWRECHGIPAAPHHQNIDA